MSTVIDDNTTKEWFTINVARAMSAIGMTQTELARRTGESDTRISYYVRGVNMPGLAAAGRIAEALETTVDALISRPKKISRRSA